MKPLKLARIHYDDYCCDAREIRKERLSVLALFQSQLRALELVREICIKQEGYGVRVSILTRQIAIMKAAVKQLKEATKE